MLSHFSRNIYVFARECMNRYILVRIRKLIGMVEFRANPKWNDFIKEHGDTLYSGFRHKITMKKYK